MDKGWHLIRNLERAPSPALVIYPDRVRENIRRMIALAGGTERLRPHVKTHKSAEIVRMQLEAEITRFKCATLAEAEMAAEAGAPDVLLAYQPVGPNIVRLRDLSAKFPQTRISAIVDNVASVRELSDAFANVPKPLPLYVDIDCGMGRTGVVPGASAFEVYHALTVAPGLEARGLHAYDGHIHDSSLAERTKACDEAFAQVEELRRTLENAGLAVPIVVAGGTPTFPLHARVPHRESSPGTCVLWDYGYASHFADLDFLVAALVIARVVSKPAVDRLCTDLGHKAIAAENPPPRVQFLNLPNAAPIMHSEEHLVLESPLAREFNIGDVLYGVPRHICPTVALHDRAIIVRNELAEGEWRIARNRFLTV